MTSLTEVTIQTTETVAKELPGPTRDDVLLPSDLNTVFLAILVLFSALTAAYIAAEVILPVVLAVMLKLLLQPGMRFLGRLHIPRSLAALFLILAVFAIIAGIGTAVSSAAKSWGERLPDSLPRIEERLRFVSEPIEKMHRLLAKADNMGQPAAGGGSNLGLTETLFRGTQHFASGLFETILVLFFLLISGDMFLRRLVEIMPRFKDKRQVVDISQQVEGNISAYLLTITFMNALVGVATAVVMWGCGVGDPVLWGVVAFLLNFVPIIGPIVGIALFLFAGLLAIPTLWQALLPAGLYFAIHILEGETITPLLLARRFTLNPVLVVISLIFWFWMWGVPGAILSVPMLAITKIICDEIRPLNSIGHFLEGDAT
ncbi:AI-2E family transporter [Methylovirgula ligni]|uniref:Putative PurR-regulated permease PerM n=2 Tax=Methylovirgula ligni TaxID=569860 RepID=A0A3D9YQE2_9HYPH|nr:AI-2E family transporter [Methylovirgula ligni]QAY97394.1 AI-2E family transporter [Methylovirgula ligni]REF84081.1 putative PurR-regulated permease PerM [Methylovirgula ligni]